MDLRAILNRKLDQLPEGPHTNGLRAVASHIDASVRHLERGQREADETLFTDVVFRCNQGFEGSIKEAYRVLARRDPDKKTIAEVEQYFSNGNHLRIKVLNQFRSYRQEWRNPSTHDYTLDFDEDEALLAIVSVTAFAIVLCDQIAGQLAFEAAAAQPAQTLSQGSLGPLLQLVANRTLSFVQTREEIGTTPSNAGILPFIRRALEFEGELGGFLAAELSAGGEIAVETGSTFAIGSTHAEADIVVARGNEHVVLELKLAQRKNIKNATDAALAQVLRLMQSSSVTGGVIVVYAGSSATYSMRPVAAPLGDRIQVICPNLI